MRPSGLVLILGVLAAPAVSAQEAVPGDSTSTAASRAAAWYTRPAVGVEVGYSRTDLAVGGSGNLLTSRQGAITGAYLHFPLADALAVRPELLFSLKGGSTVATIEGQGEASIDIELAYIELPLLLRASFPTGSVRPVLFAGPALAIQIGCDFNFDLGSDSTRSTCGQDNLTTVRSWDFGLVGGGGVEKRLRRATVALEARYTVGTRSVLEDVDLKNRAFGLVLAVTF
ncbi:MAG TPA: porin family protein [Gemmatimonadales bacterium]|nr:porin family protein [Gemmatimonadales bacterium]